MRCTIELPAAPAPVRKPPGPAPPTAHPLPTPLGQVFGVDVGFGQVVGSIAQDERVTVMERTNLRHLQPDNLPCKARACGLRARFARRGAHEQASLRTGAARGASPPPAPSWRRSSRLPATQPPSIARSLPPHPRAHRAQVDLVTLDLSFISVLKVLPAVAGVLKPEGGQLVVLIKPQFEAGRGAVSAGGVVRDPKVGRRRGARQAEGRAAQRLASAHAAGAAPLRRLRAAGLHRIRHQPRSRCATTSHAPPEGAPRGDRARVRRRRGL